MSLHDPNRSTRAIRKRLAHAFRRPHVIDRMLRMTASRPKPNRNDVGPGLGGPPDLDPEMAFRADRHRFELERRSAARSQTAEVGRKEPGARQPAPRGGRQPSPKGPVSPDTPWDRDRLFRQLTTRIRARHLSPKTEQTYLSWTRRYLAHHGNRHPASLGKRELSEFLEQLATRLGLSAESQNQAASAIAFVYREVYGLEYGGRKGVTRARASKVLPRYASPEDIDRVMTCLRGRHRVAAMIMYGSGLRVSEAINLRIQDLLLHSGELLVRSGKGRKDRTTVVPRSAFEAIRTQIAAVEAQHVRDLERGGGWAPLPGALHRKDPRAGWKLSWQYLFPASRQTLDSKTGRMGRRPAHVSTLQRAVKTAVREAAAPAFISCHVFRHCFATEMLRTGCELRLLQQMMGHRDLRTTSRYLHIINRPGLNVISPLDHLPSMKPLAQAEAAAEAKSAPGLASPHQRD